MNASLVLAVLVATLSAGDATMPGAVRSLVDAELAFAKMAHDVSMRDAFLHNLAETGYVFNPGPVNGRALWEAREKSDALLAWEPIYAELAVSGDFGFTTGPWSYSPDRTSEPVAFGHFVSIWKKNRDGAWKVALDIGVDHDREGVVPPLAWRFAGRLNLLVDDTIVLRDALLGTDAAFAAAFARGAAGAFRDFGAMDVRRYRSGASPVVGLEAVATAAGEAGGGSMTATTADVASTGDLGYTMGTRGAPVAAYYVRIWRVDGDGRWRVVLDIESPVPAGD